MTKYRITEQQVSRLFEDLNQNPNYPAGADTPSAPWNQGDLKMVDGKRVKGTIKAIGYDGDEFLFLDTENNYKIYTNKDSFEESGLHNFLKDYLNVAHDVVGDDETAPSEDWTDYVDDQEISYALESYLNDMKNSGEGLSVTTDVMEFITNRKMFFVFKPDTPDQIKDEIFYSQKLRKLVG